MLVKDKVFVLRKSKYGEADLIIQGLNQNGSRVSLFARSALKSRKRFGGGVLEPTHYIHVLYQDRGSEGSGLHPLREASLIEAFDGLRTDYARLETSLYFLQAIDTISREGDPNSTALFNLLGNSLKAAETSQNLYALRVHFEVKLLSNQGVLELNEEEQILLQAQISDHEKVELSDQQWRAVAGRTQKVFQEYVKG